MLLDSLFCPILSLKRATTSLTSIKIITYSKIRLLLSLRTARLLISLVLTS
jgi:hypothetical protein